MIAKHAVFVSRGSGRVHDNLGNGIGAGEWRIYCCPAAPVSGPEAIVFVSVPWVDDIEQSASVLQGLGGIALSADGLENLAAAAKRAAATLRSGRWQAEREESKP